MDNNVITSFQWVSTWALGILICLGCQEKNVDASSEAQVDSISITIEQDIEALQARIDTLAAHLVQLESDVVQLRALVLAETRPHAVQVRTEYEFGKIMRMIPKPVIEPQETTKIDSGK